MGTGEETAAAPATLSAAAPATGGPPPPPPAAAAHSDWAASVQAFYGSGATTSAASLSAFYSPSTAAAAAASHFAWGSQPMIPPYGTPIAYSPMYAHGGVYGQPAAATGSVYIAAVAERREAAKKSKKEHRNARGVPVRKSGDRAKAASGSDEDTSSSGDSGNESSSSTGDQDFSSARRNITNGTSGDGETMEHGSATRFDYSTAESSYSGRGTPAKLPVSAPGRTILKTNLNIGRNIQNTTHASVDVRPNTANIAAAATSSSMIGQDGVIPEKLWDERELKRQRRKQSNRESARRSRLRKQQECEDLARRVDELNNENNALRSELEQLDKQCKDLESENVSIEEELTSIYGPEVLSLLEGKISNPSNMHSDDAESNAIH